MTAPTSVGGLQKVVPFAPQAFSPLRPVTYWSRPTMERMVVGFTK